MKHWMKRNKERVLGATLAIGSAFLFLAMFVLQDFVILASIAINIVLFGYSWFCG